MISWMIAMAAASDLDGTWVLESDEREVRAAIEASAEHSVSSLPAPFQSRAMRKLTGKAGICPRYELTVDDRNVAWGCEGSDPFSVTPDQLGSPVEIRHERQRVQATVTLDASELGATFEASGGRRTFVFGVAGDTLVVTQEIHNDKLASPLRWETRYRRELAP